MKTVYESFSELADAMTSGDGILHSMNCPYADRLTRDPCFDWQDGVKSFAGWLDHIGVKVNIIDGADSFYEYMMDRE